MKFIKRMNKQTKLMESLATVEAVLESIETDSRTNSNGKPFGFLHATVDNDRLTGMAYASTAAIYTAISSGDTVLLETDVANIIAGENNKWQLALPTATAVSDSDIEAAKAFLANQ